MLGVTVENRRKISDNCLPLLPDAKDVVDLIPHAILTMRQRILDLFYDWVDRCALLMQQGKAVATGSPNELMGLDILDTLLNG